MLGGILMADDVVAASTLFERVLQLALPTAYVTFAFSLVEMVRDWRDERRGPATV